MVQIFRYVPERRRAKKVAPSVDPLAFNPGSARCHIQIGRLAEAQDGAGQPLNTWPVYLDLYCEIRLLSGQELFQTNDFSSAAQYRMRMRWPGDNYRIQVGDRVFFETHVYVVQVVNNILMRNVIVELTCLEIDGTS